MLVLFVLHLILNVYCDLPDTALNITAQKQMQALEQVQTFLNEIQKKIQESRDLLKSIPSESLLKSIERPMRPLRTAPKWMMPTNLFRFLSSTVSEDSTTTPSSTTTSFISPSPAILPDKFLEARDYVLPDVGPEYKDIFMPDMERRGDTNKEAMAAVTMGLNMLFVTQPAPGEVLLGEVAFHTTTADPHPTLHSMLVKDSSGYISVGFEMFCMLVAEKDPGSVKAVLEKSGTVITRMEHERHDRFQWMNEPLRTVLGNMVGMVGPNTIQIDEIQTKARLMRETMKNRREALSDYVNRILDFADGLVKIEDGEAIFDLLDAFREFPKPDKEGKKRTAEQMCEDLIYTFSHPFYFETLDRRRLISAANRAIRERFAHLNIFRRQAKRGIKTDDRQRSRTNIRYDFKQAWYTQPNSRIPIHGHKFSISHRNRAIDNNGFRRNNHYNKDQKNNSKRTNKIKPTRNSIYRSRMIDRKVNEALGKQKIARAQRTLVSINTNKNVMIARNSVYPRTMNDGKVNKVLGKQKRARTQRRLVHYTIANKNVMIARNSIYESTMIPIANKNGVITPNWMVRSTMIPIANKNGTITPNSMHRSTMLPIANKNGMNTPNWMHRSTMIPIANKNEMITPNSMHRSTMLPIANKNGMITPNWMHRSTMIPIANKNGTIIPNSMHRSTMLPIANKNGMITPNWMHRSTMITIANKNEMITSNSMHRSTMIPIANKNGMITPNWMHRSTMLPIANKNGLITPNSMHRSTMIPIGNKNGMITPNWMHRSTMLPIANKNGMITRKSISRSTMYHGKVNSVLKEQKTARTQRRLPISNKHVIDRNSIYRSTMNDGKVNEVIREQKRARTQRRLEPIMYTRKTINFDILNDAKVAEVPGARQKARTQRILVAASQRKTKSMYAKQHINAKEITRYKNLNFRNLKLRPTVFRRYIKHQNNLQIRLKDTNQSNTENQNKSGTKSKILPTNEIKRTTRLISEDVEINKTDDLSVDINQSDERIVLDVKLLNRILNVTSEESMTHEKLLDESVATDDDEDVLKNLYDAFYN